ncbi:hypothetical protein [Xanthomonas campestris]|uniref:hypothetical protein n=1 Tax=Xanthomonas TaxID=338 RepID=UPI001E3E9069|nr:hypothetical protein [Xanthomonas campestris]MCC5091056.1 hypothetical protein [Xanthomonas campestris]
MINQASFLYSAAPDLLSPRGEQAARKRHGGLACYRHVVARAAERNERWAEGTSAFGMDSTMTDQASFLSRAAPDFLFDRGEQAPRAPHDVLAWERLRGHARAQVPSEENGERTSTSGGTAP